MHHCHMAITTAKQVHLLIQHNAQHPIDNIALHIELDIECNHQATSASQYLKTFCYIGRRLLAHMCTVRLKVN